MLQSYRFQHKSCIQPFILCKKTFLVVILTIRNIFLHFDLPSSVRAWRMLHKAGVNENVAQRAWNDERGVGSVGRKRGAKHGTWLLQIRKRPDGHAKAKRTLCYLKAKKSASLRTRCRPSAMAIEHKFYGYHTMIWRGCQVLFFKKGYPGFLERPEGVPKPFGSNP